MVRVKLTRLGAPSALKLTVDCDYYLASDPSVRIPSGKTAVIAVADGGMTLSVGRQSVALGETVKLMRSKSGNRGVHFEQPELSNCFCGDLGLSASGGVITAILNIYIENYLYGVVGYAMPPSSGIEALKAQAVASRTYALRRRASRGDAPYDLTDSASDQVFKGYSGTSDYANVIRAVDDTRGGVLYYGSALAQCYWCASNGGQTESSKNAFGIALDYAVVRDDSYDFESSAAPVKTAAVSKDLTGLKPELKQALIDGLRAKLIQAGVDIDAADVRVEGLESVTACDSRFSAPSRLYKSLTFKVRVSGKVGDGTRKTGDISVSIPTYGGFEDWYGLSLNDEDNETVWVRETESAFEIAFRRSGSGVGMSQRGAQTMAQQGRRASEILSYYYPGVEGRRLELSDATRDARAVEPAAEQKVIATARLADRTDLMDAPDFSGAVTASVAAGAAVEVYGVKEGWAAVSSSGKYGYVPTDALESFTLAGATVVRAEGTVLGRVKTASDILQLPVASAKAVGYAEAGSEVQVYAWTEDWLMLRTAVGLKGFLPVKAVDFAAPETDSSDAPAPAEEPNALAEAEGTPEARIKADGELMSGPDVFGDTVERLKAGAVVRVLAYSRDWAQVRTAGGRTGYVRLVDLEAVGASDVEGGEIHKVKGKKYLYVQSDLAAMYANWSEDSEVLAALCRGEKVRLGAYNTLWACVRFGDQTGFVLMSALSETAPTAAEGGAFKRVKAETTATAARDGVALTGSMSGDARTLAKLDRGQRVRVAAHNAQWALVIAEAGTGFVPMADLNIESLKGSVTWQSCEGRVTSDTKVYTAADKGSAVLGRLEKGDSVQITAWNDSFARIDYDGGAGYVKLKHLERMD